jgi:hypothetical protein
MPDIEDAYIYLLEHGAEINYIAGTALFIVSAIQGHFQSAFKALKEGKA